MSNISNVLPKIREFDGHDWFSTKTHRRNLPHWELKGSTYFITICVQTEITKPFLDVNLASFMIARLNRDHKTIYDLQAFVVMPDHLHLLIKPLGENGLSLIMKNIKGSTANALNKMLNRTGKFWQAENFDHLVRDGLDLRDKWEYIKENPVKARLVDKPENYPFSSFFVTQNES